MAKGESEKEDKSVASRGAARDKADDGKKSAAASDKDGGKGGDGEQPASAEGKNQGNWEKELEIHAANPDMHWTDVVYRANRVRVVDLAEQIKGKLVKI